MSDQGEDESDSLGEVQERIAGLSDSLQRLGDGLPSFELRWQLQKCHANLLMVHGKSTPKQVALFTESLDGLRENLAKT